MAFDSLVNYIFKDEYKNIIFSILLESLLYEYKNDSNKDFNNYRYNPNYERNGEFIYV